MFKVIVCSLVQIMACKTSYKLALETELPQDSSGLAVRWQGCEKLEQEWVMSFGDWQAPCDVWVPFLWKEQAVNSSTTRGLVAFFYKLINGQRRWSMLGNCANRKGKGAVTTWEVPGLISAGAQESTGEDVPGQMRFCAQAPGPALNEPAWVLLALWLWHR